MNPDKIYVVKYCGGDYEDFGNVTVFATTKKSVATRYVTKFNRILKKWKNHYKQFETNEMGIDWIKQEFVERHFDRWNRLQNISTCYYEEVLVRS
jgi:hypothetical protein